MLHRFLPTLAAVSIAIFIMWRCYEIGYDAGYGDVSQEHYVNYKYQMQLAQERAKRLNERLVSLDAQSTKENQELRDRIDELQTLAQGYVAGDRCLDGYWLQLHNAAAALSEGTHTPPARLDDGAAGGIDPRDALDVVTQNYGDCAVYIKQIEGLQNYIQAIILSD